MLKNIRLRNFRQHEDRSWDFGPGLNAVRGENEAGKTTVLEAFFYFCFGVRALREPLADVVTYGLPESKLRVDVEIEYLGVAYTGYRAASGAEVSFGNEKVVGQSKVTEFFEQLFGADAKMAGRLMFASQKALAESLKAGPTDAGKLIESLADFDQIENVIAAIQRQRPTGRTDAAEARVATLQAQVEQGLDLEDLEPLKGRIEVARERVTANTKIVERTRQQLENLDVAAARQILADDARLGAAIERADAEAKQLAEKLRAAVPAAPPEADIEAARAAVQDQRDQAAIEQLHGRLKKLGNEVLWDEPLSALQLELENTIVRVQKLHQTAETKGLLLKEKTSALSALQRSNAVKLAQLQGQLIKETTCALCRKDLSDVPEVVSINSSVTREIAAHQEQAAREETTLAAEVAVLEGEVARAREDLKAAEQYRIDLDRVRAQNEQAEQLYASVEQHITVDRSVVPGRWAWTGPTFAAGAPDAAVQLRALEQQRDAALAAAAQRLTWEERLTQLKVQAAQDAAARRALPRADACETLDLEKSASTDLKQFEEHLRTCQNDLRDLEHTLTTKQAVQAQQQKALEQAREQLAQAEKDLADMRRYNALLKKVRDARPAITNKLWNIVLAGASKHFSDIRGEKSVITREGDTFRCNGHPVAGLSGSAEDMLGLALRITLTKTFLPTADFLQLDEPGAACSDAREQRMLGVISTLGFGQVILISHNDLVDSFCDHIITV